MVNDGREGPNEGEMKGYESRQASGRPYLPVLSSRWKPMIFAGEMICP